MVLLDWCSEDLMFWLEFLKRVLLMLRIVKILSYNSWG